jgi:hypothetical protein
MSEPYEQVQQDGIRRANKDIQLPTVQLIWSLTHHVTIRIHNVLLMCESTNLISFVEQLAQSNQHISHQLTIPTIQYYCG